MPGMNLPPKLDPLVEFHVRRSEAIAAYAGLEQSLAIALARLLGTDYASGETVFFQIVNTRSRNRILSDLVRSNLPREFEAFWFGIPMTENKRGLINIIQDLDIERNRIVHWHDVQDVEYKDRKPNSLIWLDRPGKRNGTDEKTRLSTSDFLVFLKKAFFASRCIDQFVMHTYATLPAPWPDIFLQPCLYPPPRDHPLSGG